MNHNQFTIQLIFILLVFLMSGCGSYSITKDSFIEQLKEGQDVEEIFHWSPVISSRYPSNQLDSILCLNKDGGEVYLFPDQNTQIRIKSNSTDKIFKAYFDTVIYKDSILYGLRSRLIGGKQQIEVSDIKEMTFKAEFPKTKKVK